MTEITTKVCSKCGTPLTVAFYGYEGCGMHVLDEYEPAKGYRVDATDGFGDWGDGPTWLWVPLDALPEVTTFYMTRDRCCGRMDLEDDQEVDWCPKCGDVMEPADTTSPSEEAH